MRRKIDIRSASLDKRKATGEGIKVLDVEKVMEFFALPGLPAALRIEGRQKRRKSSLKKFER
jgi:hypothetical protein